MRLQPSFLTIILFLFSWAVQAQVGIGTENPDASAMLQIEASDKGVLITRVALSSTTDNSTVTSPASGLLVYNTATAGIGDTAVSPGFYFFNGSVWVRLLNTGNVISNTASITANTNSASTNQNLIDANTTNINTNTASITINTTSINSNISKITSNTSSITSNTASITANTNAIANLTDSDTTYSAGTGLSLAGTEFAVDSSVVTSTYGGDLALSGKLTAGSGIETSGTVTATAFVGDGSGLTNLNLPEAIYEGSSSLVSNVYTSTQDFVFGSTQLDNISGTDEDNSRFFFDKSKGAFRAGISEGDYWNEDNLGQFSFAVGSNTKATGVYSISMGNATTASQTFSVAIGNGSDASGYNSTAIGGNVKSSGSYATAIGNRSTASGHASFAQGDTSLASGAFSVAMGSANTASEAYSMAMGGSSKAKGTFSVALGNTATASGHAFFLKERTVWQVALFLCQWVAQTQPVKRILFQWGIIINRLQTVRFPLGTVIFLVVILL